MHAWRAEGLPWPAAAGCRTFVRWRQVACQATPHLLIAAITYWLGGVQYSAYSPSLMREVLERWRGSEADVWTTYSSSSSEPFEPSEPPALSVSWESEVTAMVGLAGENSPSA